MSINRRSKNGGIEALTVGAVGGKRGGVGGLEEVAEVLPLAAAGLALGVLVRRLHLLEHQRRRQQHLRPHYLRLHPPPASSSTPRRDPDFAASPPLGSLRVREASGGEETGRGWSVERGGSNGGAVGGRRVSGRCGSLFE